MFRALLAVALASGLTAVPAAAAELGDPTRPPSFMAGGSGDTEEGEEQPRGLTSILISKNRRMAVINGQMVRAGDEVSGGRVVRIDVSGVVLSGLEGEYVLSLSGTPVKTRVASERAARR